ncbi:patellin-3 [Vigna radiata var. radiata]|uniref:Patellin-3 n=1 Tax=Vigna radiata var. radiata TaxID=3916 RepID=A0A1S3TL45_VIGRR|nr:patellin-3 [Vigna radiata var. radiata]
MAENDSNPPPPPPAASPPQEPPVPPSLSSENDAKVDDVVEEKVKAEEVLVAEEKDKEKDEVKGVEEAVVVEEKEKEKEEEKEEEKEKEKEEEVTVGETESESLKEESNRVSDSERKGIEELKKVVREELERKEEGEVSIWGVPLFKDQRTDVILLKFLRARDLRVNDALVMIQNTLRWRKEFGIDALLEEDLGEELEKVVFMHGHGREGHPVCYNVYGEFQNKELYQKAFSTEENRTKFLRWRIQLLERSIRNLDFTPGGINTIFQVNDLKNSPGPAKRELRLATKQALQLLQDNYPEFVAKQIFINAPWWYLAFNTMISPFLTPRTKSKFIFAGPSKSPDTLFKYISPEQVPVQYGGLSVDFCDCNPDFTMSDPVTEIPIKPTTKQTVEIAIYEKCIIVWELRVVGWEVSYNAEFKPDAKDAYTVVIQKATKMSPTDEPVVSNSFKVGELGKLLLTIDNPTLKKKRLLYRFNIKPYCD